MSPALFYIFATITLLFGVMVIASKNPVTNALSLAVSFIGLAALFVSLDAYFIGTIQVLVYAGAVMVLFLFIIMLLDIKAVELMKPNYAAVAAAVILGAVLLLQVATVLTGNEAGRRTTTDTPLRPQQALAAMGDKALPTIANDLKAGILPDTKLMGLQLYHQYAFHLQIVGLLLLVGTVGVVVLSKKERAEGGGPSK
jgi:NADH-quinone oxidoreductase subunit J